MTERYFVTGGTGSLGSKLVKHLLATTDDIVVCYSRDPHKQNRLLTETNNNPNLRCVIGDIRDKDRLWWWMRGATAVAHCAALKHVDIGEYNSSEYESTNIVGSRNVMETAVKLGVQKAIIISSDKSVAAANLYGRTKAVAERSWIRFNTEARGKTLLSALRYGNVFDSQGNVVQVWRDRLQKGLPIIVREPDPTRFICFLRWGVKWIIDVLACMRGGEVFVPCNLRTLSIHTLARQFSPEDQWQRLPLGSGEKQHEVLLSPEEIPDTVTVGHFWVVNPLDHQWKYEKRVGAPVDVSQVSSATAPRMPVGEFLVQLEEKG